MELCGVNANICLGMLNKSRIHLNVVDNFCYSMNAWQDETCIGTRSKTEKEESAIAKRVNQNLVFNINSSNTDRPVNPTVNNYKSLSGNSSAEERVENDVFPSSSAHRLQNGKNVTISTLNVNSLTYFSPVSHFCTPWKRQKTFGFLTFSGGIEMWHWTKMG